MKKRILKNCIRIPSKNLISGTKRLMITLEKKGKNKNQYIRMHLKDNCYGNRMGYFVNKCIRTYNRG